MNINTSIPCPCQALQNGKVSIEQFENLISFHRDFTCISPYELKKWEDITKQSSSFADFLVNNFFQGLLEICVFDDNPEEMQNLIENKGALQSGNKSFKLIMLQNKESTLPIGAMLLQTKHKKQGPQNSSLRIVALRIDNLYLKKYIATILMSYAVKVAHNENRDFVKLDSSDEAIIPYLRFGFAHCDTDPSDWKKMSQKDREEFALRKPFLSLNINLPETKVAMNEQFYRAITYKKDSI